MKKIFVIILSTTFLTTVSNAQSKSGGGSSGGSSTSPETGFVYYLKYQKHLAYAASHLDTYYFTYAQLVDMHKFNMFGIKFDNKHLFSTTLYFDRKAVEKPSFDPINLTDYNLRVFHDDKEVTTDPIDSSKVAKLKNDDTVLIIKILYTDSISRFWAVDRHVIFTQVRLKTAITQDSAILSPKILYNQFGGPGENANETNTYQVTNPHYRGQLNHFQHQYYISGSGIPSFTFSDSIMNKALAVYDQAKKDNDVVKELDAFDKAKMYLKNLVGSFEEDLKKLNKQEDDYGTNDNISKNMAKDVSKEYQVLYQRYHVMEGIYYDLSLDYKTNLNNQYRKLGDPDNPAKAAEQMAYIDAVLQLQAQFPRIVPALPTNTFDKTISETAIPIENKDSSANFYFKILHKTFANQPIYYLPLHFGAWDYGTLIIPYRYRPAPSNKYVFGQAGHDSTAAAQSVSEGSISLALYLGRKWGRTRFYEDPGQSHNTLSFETTIVTGPTLVPLSIAVLDTTSKYINAKTGYNYAGPSNMFCWTVGLGAVLEWKSINFGLFVGRDFPLIGKTGWVYANKTWFGFGIGVNIGTLASGNSVN